jgi:hypothetical protein
LKITTNAKILGATFFTAQFRYELLFLTKNGLGYTTLGNFFFTKSSGHPVQDSLLVSVFPPDFTTSARDFSKTEKIGI